MDPKGEGNCTGSKNVHFGKVICYVEQPTSCSDARDSVEYAGEKYSALACCACKDLVDHKGEGNCAGSKNGHFGKVICYVEQPTSCSDARDSVVHAGEKYSAQACTVGGKNAISRNTSIIYSIIYNNKIKKKIIR